MEEMQFFKKEKKKQHLKLIKDDQEQEMSGNLLLRDCKCIKILQLNHTNDFKEFKMLGFV